MVLFEHLFEWYDDFPFPILHIMPSVALLVIHVVIEQEQTEMVRKYSWLLVHFFSFYLPINAISFSIWVGHQPQLFAIIFLSTNFPLIFHFFRVFYDQNVHKWYYINVCTMLNINTLLFILWWWTGKRAFPWFIYPLYASGAYTTYHTHTHTHIHRQ